MKKIKLIEGDVFHMGDENIKYVVELRNSVLIGRQLHNRSYVGLDYWRKQIVKIGNSITNPELLK